MAAFLRQYWGVDDELVYRGVDDELVAYVRAAFGWDADVAVSAGRRGALGRIWRLDAGAASYALKEIFGEPPPRAVVEAELTFARLAAGAGVRLPAGHADRRGRHLLAGPGGRWLRLYDWTDARPADPAAPGTPRELGTLLARLHRCAPATPAEPGGEPPDPWYDRAPAPEEWTRAAAAAREAAAPWAARLGGVLDALPGLGAVVTPAHPAELILCHRDLHPENVLAGAGGELVVVDWDGLGPATPARELARALFDWFCDSSAAGLDAVAATYEAYVRAGGPGRVTALADFSMLVASRLNFLLRQIRLALDPHAERRHRDWAEREIDEALHLMPAPAHLAAVLDVVRNISTA